MTRFKRVGGKWGRFWKVEKKRAEHKCYNIEKIEVEVIGGDNVERRNDSDNEEVNKEGETNDNECDSNAS